VQLGLLLEALPEYRLDGNPATEITALAWDSRRVCPGSVFVAYHGVATDGHAYVGAAVESGAAAIVGEHDSSALRRARQIPRADIPYVQVPNGREALAWLSAAWHGFPARRLTMVGVTGTDGKTTTVNVLYHILRAAGRRVGMISTVNACFDDRTVDTGLHTTTPDAFDVQRLLEAMVRAGIDTCILETTSHGLAQHRVTACDFDVAVVTNITHEHLDLHGSLDAYRAAKAMLFEGLARGARKPAVPKVAVLNRGDGSYDYLHHYPADRTVTYSIHTEADVTASDVRYTPAGTQFVMHSPHGECTVETALVGDFNVANVLAATAAAQALGVRCAAVRQGLGAFQGVPGRMERVDRGQAFAAIVDFAHTPNSLRQAVLSGRRLVAPGGRMILVFGCAGQRDEEKRRLMGRAAAELANYAVLTAEDPRTESVDTIIEAIAIGCREGGGVEGVAFERVPDRGAAVARAVQLAGAGDVLMICGKGHEQSMCFGNVEYAWDDRTALAAALEGRVTGTLPTSGVSHSPGGSAETS
jgi:UDP-N-acetylmuramoyl-L-alanyl-D-glutamate--2,6-diaminopimelate ligase